MNSVYDENGHLCPFDSGLVERNVQLYFSGYIKPVYDEDSSPKGKAIVFYYYFFKRLYFTIILNIIIQSIFN